MPRRTILAACVLTALLLIVANTLVGRASRNSVPRQTMRVIDTAPPVIDLLGMGSSLVAAGFDAGAIENTFRSAGHTVVAVNGGLGGTSSIEHLLLTRRALQHHTVEQLIYGFSDQVMADDTPMANSDLLGNHAMLYYEEPQIALQYARFDWLNLIAFQTDRCCALLRERGTIWSKVEKLRRAMGAYGMPAQASNRFGRVEDFDLLEASSPEVFTERCNRYLESGRMFSSALEELFKEASAHGAKITLVEMPMHSSHVKTFYDLPIWAQYRRANRQAIGRYGGNYIDASHWIAQDDLFADHIHLGPAGAIEFSHLLAEQFLPGQPATLASSR